MYLRGHSLIDSSDVLNGRDVRQNMVLNDCILESRLLYHGLLESLEIDLLDLLERELPRPHRLRRIWMLERRVVDANHAAIVVEDQCRVDIGVLGSEGGKLISTVCELHALIRGVGAGLLSLMVRGKSSSVLRK